MGTQTEDLATLRLECASLLANVESVEQVPGGRLGVGHAVVVAAGLTPETYAGAIEHLAAADPVLAGVARRWGPPPFQRHPEGFAGLVHGILAQQVSLESAVAAFGRLEGALGRVEPEAFLMVDDARLRTIGFSRQKASYARGLASAIMDGALDLERLVASSDDEVRGALVALRGIGPWTADVYLLFALRRPDAWPSGDLATSAPSQSVALAIDSIPRRRARLIAPAPRDRDCPTAAAR